jgi:hypothetical protein
VDSFVGVSSTALASTTYPSAYQNAVVRGSWNLEFYQGLYAELVSYTNPNFKWGDQTYLKTCRRSLPYLAIPYKHQVVIVDAGPQTYTFNWPTVCPGVTLTLAWSVFDYATIPSFLSLANGTG